MGDLFDRRLRTDESRREDNEGIFVFLGRSARPSSSEVRQLLGDWLSHVPEGPDRNQLRGALANRKHDESFESGFWELYLHEAYRRSGYMVTIHPDLPDERTHPDFLVEGNGRRFYLEAVRVGTSTAHRGQAQRLADMRTKLRAQRAEQFILSVTCHVIGLRALKTGELIAFLDQWLIGLSQEANAGRTTRSCRASVGLASGGPGHHPRTAGHSSSRRYRFPPPCGEPACPWSEPSPGASPTPRASAARCVERWKPRRPR